MIINEIFLENAFTIAVAVAVANVAALVDTAGAANNLQSGIARIIVRDEAKRGLSQCCGRKINRVTALSERYASRS